MPDNGEHNPEPWLATQAGGIRDLIAWRDSDGTKYMASGGTDSTIRIWDADTGKLIGSPLVAHSDGVRALASWRHRDSILLASGGSDGKVCIWDPFADTPLIQIITEHDSGVMVLANWSSPEGDRLATGSYDGTIRIFNPESGSLVTGPLRGHNGAIVSLVFWHSTDGRERLASGSDDGTIRVWDPEDGSLVTGPLRGHTETVEALALWHGPDNNIYVVSGSQDGTLLVWDPETGNSVGGPYMACPDGVWALFSWIDNRGRLWFASGDVRGTIQLWDLEVGEPVVEIFTGSSSPVASLVDMPDGGDVSLFISASVDSVIRIWDVDSGAEIRAITTGHVSAVWSLACWQTQDGDRRLAFAGADAIVRICDPDKGIIIAESATTHGSGIWALASWAEEDGEARIVSGSVDGTIQTWDSSSCTSIGPSYSGHTASVSSFASWKAENDRTRLASAGDDSVIRVWDPEAQVPIGNPMVGHTGGLLALAAWRDPSGAARLVSGGADGTLRVWDPDTGAPVGSPLASPGRGIWALCCWQLPDGTARIASGEFGGTIRLWDPVTGASVGDPLSGHVGPVRALTWWPEADGSIRLASGGPDGIRIWDPAAGVCVGDPMTGHNGVRALACWRTHDGSIRLASAGDDGTVRLWDPERRLAIRTVEVGAVAIWGLSDAPATVDVLGRETLAEAIASQLRPHGDSLSTARSGPTVVTVEGAWGCGKTTLMDLVRHRLVGAYRQAPAEVTSNRKRLTVREAARDLRRAQAPAPTAAAPTQNHGSGAGIVTAWFNPWAHQSGEQIWAGLAQAITEAVAPVLYPTEPDRERYWFALNLARIDRHALRRLLQRRILSPLLGVALVTVALPLTISFVELGKSSRVFGYSANAATLALGLPIIFLIVGSVHTLSRYWWGRAVNYLPGDIFYGAVSDRNLSGVTGEPNPSSDPLRQATRGSLYLHQHDVKILLSDIAALGNDLVVFIDDLDRCTAVTTAEVFEGINLFLSGLNSNGLSARFVVGMDPTVIAAHLDQVHSSLSIPQAARQGDDPSAGWTYLRKLVQLPVIVPQISDHGLDDFIDSAAGLRGRKRGPDHASTVAHTSGSVARQPEESSNVSLLTDATRIAVPEQDSTIRGTPSHSQGTFIIPWRTMERHPLVRGLMQERLTAQADRSIREAKRLINVWQLYARILSSTYALESASEEVARARNLVILAEIIVRWPALHRFLFQRMGERTGLQLLAEAGERDGSWQSSVDKLGIDTGYHRSALASLHSLLQQYDGGAVGLLAGQLL